MLRLQHHLLCAAAVLCGWAQAQVQPVASDSFDYTHPGLLMDGAGGSGWSNNWWVSGAANDDIVIFDQTVAPALGLADAIGKDAGQAVEFGNAFRQLDLALHPELVDPASGTLGLDRSNLWFPFSTVTYQQFGEH